MDNEKQKQLTAQLERLEKGGASFYEAKQKLLELGYTEDDISIAAASAPFDGKIIPKKDDTPQGAIQESEAAAEMARELLQMDSERRMRETRASGAAASFLSSSQISPMGVRSGMHFADSLGIPLFRIGIVGVFIFAALYGLARFSIIGWSIVFAFAQWYIIGVIAFIVVVYAIAEIKAFVGRHKK